MTTHPFEHTVTQVAPCAWCVKADNEQLREQLDAAVRRAAELERRITAAQDEIYRALPDAHDRDRRVLNAISRALRTGVAP